MHTKPAVIIGHWETKDVWINGKRMTPAAFVRDLTAAEREPGDNLDIVKECRGVRRFRWGDTSQATYCLALACCFYLKCSWVMDRFFTKELERGRQADVRLEYDENELQAAYKQCEEMFAREFEEFMGALGAKWFEE